MKQAMKVDLQKGHREVCTVEREFKTKASITYCERKNYPTEGNSSATKYISKDKTCHECGWCEKEGNSVVYVDGRATWKYVAYETIWICNVLKEQMPGIRNYFQEHSFDML